MTLFINFPYFTIEQYGPINRLFLYHRRNSLRFVSGTQLIAIGVIEKCLLTDDISVGNIENCTYLCCKLYTVLTIFDTVTGTLVRFTANELYPKIEKTKMVTYRLVIEIIESRYSFFLANCIRS